MKQTLLQMNEGKDKQQKTQHNLQETQDEDKQNKKHDTICVGHRCTQTNTYSVNKT